MRTLEELRASDYHQQLGQKMCAAFVAQQQGISVSSALKKVELPVGDLWLMVAEYAWHGYATWVEGAVKANPSALPTDLLQ